jgi:hypothetical protein
MKIHNECTFLKYEGIRKIEEKYNAKYVFESCLKTKDGGWCNMPVAIFYTDTPHPQGSNYFGLYRTNTGEVMITNGISATEPFKAIQVEDNIYYSRYRHDYRSYGNFFVDGGRDYIRYGGEPFGIISEVSLCVNKDKLEIVDA